MWPATDMRVEVRSRTPSPFGEKAASLTDIERMDGGTVSAMNFVRIAFHSSVRVPS
jgi:hypothetical protein